MNDTPKAVPFGDRGILVELGGASSVAMARRLHHVARVIRGATAGERGWWAPVPAAASVLVPVDALEPGVESALERVRTILDALPVEVPPDERARRRVEIATHYGGEAGPDLSAVAEMHGLRERDVIELHAAVDYEVLFLGFAPGFAYLGDLPEAIATPRLATPRVRVPAGSVAIAGRQTAVYPFESPGGWQLIGRTDVRLWDVERDAPALLTPGTRVRFVPLA